MPILMTIWESHPWSLIELSTITHLVLFAVVTLHILHHRREPTSAILWLFVAWFLPFLGPLCYLAFGIYKLPRKALHKRRADQRLLEIRRELEDADQPLVYWRAVHESLAAEPESEEARDLNRAMNGILEDYPLLGGNQVKLLITGEEAYPLMLDAIRRARHHIHLQTFILKNDSVGRHFLDALAAKAQAGIAVRLLYDRFGSTEAVLTGLFRRYRNEPNLHLAGWTQANPLKRQFQINLRNHRKLLIIDGEEAFTGGLNLDCDNVPGPGQPAIRDFHFKLMGPIVQELQFSFFRDWHYMTTESPANLLSREYYPSLTACGRSLVRVVNSGPTSEMEAIGDIFFISIISARKRLLAMTPYFAPTLDIQHALRSAAQRGVEVTLVVPRENNHAYVGLAGRALYEDLLHCGIRIFERRPPFMHAKAMIVDDQMAIVGSANLDVRSLRLNYETNLMIFDAEFIHDLRQAVFQEMGESEEIFLMEWQRRPLRQQLLENFCSLLTPIL